MVGACPAAKAERSRPRPLPSGQVVTPAPSGSGRESASNHNCRPAVTGGVALPLGACVTTVVACELALWLPTVLVAVTTARMVKPMSVLARVSVEDVAPAMFVQAAP